MDRLTFRTNGGILDLYFFFGATVGEVVSQYTELVGRPAFPPYWALGFHQCRYGYPSPSYESEVLANYTQANIPIDTMWSDIDYMDHYRDWTTGGYDGNFALEEVQAFVAALHKTGHRYVVIIDPGIEVRSNYSSYTRLIDRRIHPQQQGRTVQGGGLAKRHDLSRFSQLGRTFLLAH
jgi:alpha-glucosidase (family GH31 glycosyl hydrolase)